MKNIVLIGMPGCGKSTIGRILSDETELDFVDLDDYVVENNGMTIEEMFNQGEEFFRSKETEAVKAVSKNSGTIISTGGGVIKLNENMTELKANGIIIFIDRTPEKIIETLDDSVRPLLKDGIERIFELYKERYELYKKYSNMIISNNEELEKAVSEIKARLRLDK
ncbi:MAG: shikimate kinase [Clostridium sp.]